ncbi:amino acid adenylation domain-containing protein [Saccharopolyspora erythraea]
MPLLRRGVQFSSEGGALRLRAARGALSSAEQDALKQHKSEILDFLDGRTACPLTGVQDRIWFLNKLDPTGVAYTFSVAYRIKGPVDTSAFADALDAVVRRHPALRTTFHEVNGAPVQFVEPGLTPVLRSVDIIGASHDEVDQRLRAELIAPFDLAQGPLLRSVLLRSGDQEYIWGLSLHHLIADGWTTGLIVREMSEIMSGNETTAEGALDYTDYVGWERERAADPGAASNLDYWVNKLNAVTPVELPLDRPRPPQRGYEGGRVDFALPPELAAELAEFGRSEAATTFGTLLAVYLVLVFHYTEQEDLVVGTPHANRLDQKFEGTAGCFVSTLVLRSGVSAEMSFRDVLRRVAQVCAEAWDHQDYSYEKLVGELVDTRDLSRNALFQVFFALQDAFQPLRVPGTTAELYPFDDGTVQFDLELHFFPGEDEGLLGSFLYDTALFERSSIEAMGRRWLDLAKLLLASPDAAIGELSLLSAQEHSDLEARNSTEADYDKNATVDQLLARQAGITPERTALACRGSELSYAELDHAVSALAGRIRAVQDKGERVGIFLDRSADIVTAVLAAARAGAVYVPLATDLPPERMSWIIEDTGMRLVITHSDIATRLPDEIRPLLVDRDSEPPVDGRSEPPAAVDPAYVLHTSGSTGKPKGVEVRHDNLLNLLHAMARKPGITSQDVLLAVTSLSFDISMLELLLPLITGAKLVVASEEEAADPVRLAELMTTSGATIMQATPSTWRMLFDSGWQGREQLKALCGGEALSRDLADRLVQGCAEVWNVYGPTETTIWSARWKVTAEGPVRIGEPIENTRFYVVNQRGRLVPPGVPGELCIAGDGVANGYLNRPEETERRFVDLAAAKGFSERVYRTGDLVRQIADGSLVFLGRTDHQLKVRGHRVEAAEIEHVLRRHPSISEAVVTLAANATLVAHVEVIPDGSVSSEELRDLLAPSLPGYMVPQRFVVHEEFPLTPNGKVDRKTLSAMPVEVGSDDEKHEPPNGEVEAFIAQVYSDLLDRNEVGRYDGFFDLGGHSLLATRALYQIKERYGVQVQLQDLFANPTVEALAAQIESAMTRSEQDDREIGTVLDQLESMSDEEVARLLAGLE